MQSPEQAVLNALGTTVKEDGLQPGARLPTERDLSVRSGQGRTVVRRVLSSLEAEGRITRHVGRGTFLLAPIDGEPQQLELLSGSPADIMTARQLLEPAMIPVVVANATDQDFDEIERCLEGGERTQRFQEFEYWDGAFHSAVLYASHNVFLRRVADLLAEAREQPLWGRLKLKAFTAERCTEYAREHRDIADLLLARETDKAQEAMSQHLNRVRLNTFGNVM